MTLSTRIRYATHARNTLAYLMAGTLERIHRGGRRQLGTRPRLLDSSALLLPTLDEELQVLLIHRLTRQRRTEIVQELSQRPLGEPPHRVLAMLKQTHAARTNSH